MNNKTRHIIHIISGCVAIISAVILVILVAVKLTNKKEAPVETTEPSNIVVTAQNTEETDGASTEGNSDETEFRLPTPTKPHINYNKNYTVFVNPVDYNITETDSGVLTAQNKDNKSVKMTVTPVKDKSFAEVKRRVSQTYSQSDKYEKLNIDYTNITFEKVDGDITSVVYLVDDNKGGCIKIQYNTTKEYAEDFEIFLTMFSVVEY